MDEIQTSNSAQAEEHEREEAEDWSRVKKAEFDQFKQPGKIIRF